MSPYPGEHTPAKARHTRAVSVSGYSPNPPMISRTRATTSQKKWTRPDLLLRPRKTQNAGIHFRRED